MHIKLKLIFQSQGTRIKDMKIIEKNFEILVLTFIVK